MDIVRPRWTSGSFLLYAGGLTVLIAAAWSLTYLADHYRSAAFVGWSALVLACLVAIAIWFRRRARRIPAGIFALLSVVAFGVFVGALESWWGWLPDNDEAPFRGFHLGLLLLELLVLIAAVVALRVFRFPLLAGAVVFVVWWFVTDVVSSGGNWSATVTLLVGLAYLPIGVALDGGPRRPYGFWLHVFSGLLIGGALLYFWHTSDTDWSLIAGAGVVYVFLAKLLGRSSWAVLGAVGLTLSAAYFAAKWSLVPYFSDEYGRETHPWAGAVVFAILGFLLVALGLLVERRGVDQERI
jgi:hypothetical protein